jgi:hypothetical protein
LSAVDTSSDTSSVAALDTAGDTGMRSDADGDSFLSTLAGGDDCDDTDAKVNPKATERCNLVDDNCDGVADEGCPTHLDAGTADSGISWTCSAAGAPSGGVLVVALALLVLWKRAR